MKLMPSSGLWGYCMHVVHRHTCRQTPIHIKWNKKTKDPGCYQLSKFARSTKPSPGLGKAAITVGRRMLTNWATWSHALWALTHARVGFSVAQLPESSLMLEESLTRLLKVIQIIHWFANPGFGWILTWSVLGSLSGANRGLFMFPKEMSLDIYIYSNNIYWGQMLYASVHLM